MKLFTKAQHERLVANFNANQRKPGQETDFLPVVKLFTPDAGATWLLTELDPETGIAFGLCDLGVGFPELGYVLLSELRSVRGKLGLPIERDRHFQPTKTLSTYAEEASAARSVMA